MHELKSCFIATAHANRGVATIEATEEAASVKAFNNPG